MTANHQTPRRLHLSTYLGADGIAIIPTAPERQRNRDSDFLYRHDSYFYYLTGFAEPNAWLVLSGDGRSTLFCAPKDLEREIWDGYRLGPEAAPAALGVDEAYSVDELDSRLPRLLENKYVVWYPFATHKGLETRVDGWLSAVRARVRFGALCPEEQRDLCGPLDEMRLVKDAHEQDVMRRAAQISARAHVRAMQLSARMLREGKDVREFHLDAELLHEFRLGGSQYPAYGSIVAAGANACVLHYRANDAELRDGDLVLIDAGCELEMYASDVTRTFPVNGVFSKPQRELYDVVLAANRAATKVARVGNHWNDPHDAAVGEVTRGLKDLGLLKGRVHHLIKTQAYRQFFMHRTGHWLGLDVHDVGDYKVAEHWRLLEPGMVMTIEPGIYVSPANKDVAKRWRGIGIRIEDDVLVTREGPDVLTADLAASVEEIEALMAARA